MLVGDLKVYVWSCCIRLFMIVGLVMLVCLKISLFFLKVISVGNNLILVIEVRFFLVLMLILLCMMLKCFCDDVL